MERPIVPPNRVERGWPSWMITLGTLAVGLLFAELLFLLALPNLRAAGWL